MSKQQGRNDLQSSAAISFDEQALDPKLREIFEQCQDKVLSKEQFDKILEVVINIKRPNAALIMDRLFQIFDENDSKRIGPKELAKGFNALISKNEVDKHLFVFRVFDFDDDNHVSQKEFEAVITMLWNNHIAQETFDLSVNESYYGSPQNFVRIYFQMADVNDDGYVDLEEYSKIYPRFSWSGYKGGRFVRVVSENERFFYERVLKSDSRISSLFSFIPKAYTIEEVRKKFYVSLEDVSFNFQKPSFLVVRISETGIDLRRLIVFLKSKGSFEYYRLVSGSKKPDTRSILRIFFKPENQLLKNVLLKANERIIELSKAISALRGIYLQNFALMIVYDSQSEKILKNVDYRQLDNSSLRVCAVSFKYIDFSYKAEAVSSNAKLKAQIEDISNNLVELSKETK